MKYLLKQNKEDKGIFCDKVTIDGFHYYVSDGNIGNEYYYHINLKQILHRNNSHIDYLASKKAIATNNPNIDIPKVVDEVERLFPTNRKGDMWMPNRNEINNQYRQEGYNKSQETHPFSEEDMVAFAEYKENIMHNDLIPIELISKTTKELLQIWGEQHPIVIYYQ